MLSSSRVVTIVKTCLVALAFQQSVDALSLSELMAHKMNNEYAQVETHEHPHVNQLRFGGLLAQVSATAKLQQEAEAAAPTVALPLDASQVTVEEADTPGAAPNSVAAGAHVISSPAPAPAQPASPAQVPANAEVQAGLDDIKKQLMNMAAKGELSVV